MAFTYNASVNGGYYGGLVAYTRQSGAKYIDCHTTGAVVTKGIKYLGGLLGAVAPDTEGTMTDCSNAGSIVLNYGALGMGGGHAAGCVGNTEKSKWTFTRVSNSGNIDYNFGKTNGAIYSIGGAFGMACGKFEECFNTGNVVDTDGADAVGGYTPYRRFRRRERVGRLSDQGLQLLQHGQGGRHQQLCRRIHGDCRGFETRAERSQ